MKDHFLADANPPVCSLNIKDAWDGLSLDEKKYAHHLSQAAWAGGRIILRQTTPVGEDIFNLIIATFSSNGQFADLEQLQQRSGVAPDDFEAVLSYAAQFLSNLGNIKSFGAIKFVPRAPSFVFEAVVKASDGASVALPIWNKVHEKIYSLTPEAILSIGKPIDGHLSAYYIGDAPTDEQVDRIQALCDKNSVSTLNTRLEKVSDTEFKLWVASTATSPVAPYPAELKDGDLTLTLKLGDYSDALEGVNKSLQRAAESTSDSNRKEMLQNYIKSFETGIIDYHKDGSRNWVKDVGPVVETYLGFIESYVDPYGARAEWEGFVAVVNKEQSKKFNTLVDAAPQLITDLPWGKNFEVDVFQRPDFTALEILSFATGGIPAGINIPNYHDVRERDGFKNVSLSNILSAKAAGEVITFIAPDDLEGFEKWEGKAFEVQVANHELLGHGTGKIFQEKEDGTLNFDKNIINPLTGKPVDSWYKPGETYGSRIGAISSSMEEARAESVALYLASNPEILEIFNYTETQDQQDLIYYTFLLMVRAGIRALEWYDPATKKHGQAHMEARLGITNWLITHDLASIEEVRNESGELIDAFARVDRKDVLEKGKEVMGKLLVEFQVRKSTGDAKGATKFYKTLTTPTDKWVNEYRPLVLSKRLPRKIFVQPNTVIEGDNVVLKEYEVSTRGVIQSFIERGLIAK